MNRGVSSSVLAKSLIFILLLLGFGACSQATKVHAQTDVSVNGYVLSRVHPSNSTFTSDSSSLLADGVTTDTLRVTVVDVDFEPLPGRTVDVTSSRGGQVIDLIRCYNGPILTLYNQAVTDSDGKVICVISSTTPGVATLTAVAEDIELADNPVITFLEVPIPPPPPPPPPDNPPTTPPPTTEPSPFTPPPTTPAPSVPRISPPRSTLRKAIDKVIETLDRIPAALPGGLGVATLLPTVALLVPLGSSISASVMAGIPALQYLLFSAFPFFRAPRRWGKVKDATTNIPIPGVFVDLVESATGTVVKRVMTDRTGRFGFLNPKQGDYWIQVKNPLYQTRQTDIFNANQLGRGAISFDILLTPIEKARNAALQKTARYMKFLVGVQIVQMIFLIGGSLLAVGLFIRSQTSENVLLMSIYALLWVLHFISSLSYSQSGTIIEKSTDNSVNEAVVQVTSLKRGEEQFVHSTISDESGKFLVLVPPGQYTVIAAKGGYKPSEKIVSGEIQNIDMNLERLKP